MTLDELKEEVNNALKVNDERLDVEALKNQELYAKYLDHKSRFELLLHKAKGITKKCIVRNGNTMVVKQMQKYTLQNLLTSKY